MTAEQPQVLKSLKSFYSYQFQDTRLRINVA